MAIGRPVIGFLTDFGLDGAAATCKAVMLSICPDAQVVDIAHTVRKYAIADGAFLFRAALPYFPVGVHVAVVDPGVGTARRPVAIRAERGDVIIGPDNGLLVPAADALGGVAEARELTNRELWLPATSSTFHGRDIFSPVAAHLAGGDATFADLGGSIDPATLVRLEEPAPSMSPGAMQTVAVYVDSFGNVRLAGGRAELETMAPGLSDGAAVVATLPDGTELALTFVPSFGHAAAGSPVLYVDSAGNLALAINRGDLAATHRLATGAPIRLRPA